MFLAVQFSQGVEETIASDLESASAPFVKGRKVVARLLPTRGLKGGDNGKRYSHHSKYLMERC